MLPLVPGTIFRLSARVYLRDGTPVITTAPLVAADIRVVLRLRANGHAMDGYVWSTDGGGQWRPEAHGSLALPTATAPTAFARWTYALPADVLTAQLIDSGVDSPDLGDDYAIEADLLDDPTMAANETVVSEMDLIAQRLSLSELTRRVDRNADLTELGRSDHTWQNIHIIYVSPNNGDSADNGSTGTRDKPFDNLDDAIAVASTSDHPLIELIADAVGATTYLDVTAVITVNKRYLFIRGPGRDFIVRRTTAGDVFNITADGVELAGFQIETAGVGAGRGVEVASVNHVQLYRMWINETRGDAVRLTDSSHTQLIYCTLEGSGQSGSGHGLVINNATAVSHVRILSCHISAVDGDGIRAIGSSTEIIVRDCELHDNTGWGINLGANTTSCVVHDNVICNNTSGNLQNLGTNNVTENNEQWATTVQAVAILADTDAIDTRLPASPAIESTTQQGFIDTQVAIINVIDALNDLSQADILSDATPIAGADVAAILVDTTAGGFGPWTTGSVGGGAFKFAVKTPTLERPPTGGSVGYRLLIEVRSPLGAFVDPDANTITVAARNGSDTSRSANLSSVTRTTVGRYEVTYTVADDHAIEQLLFTFAFAVSAVAQTFEEVTTVIDATDSESRLVGQGF